MRGLKPPQGHEIFQNVETSEEGRSLAISLRICALAGLSFNNILIVKTSVAAWSRSFRWWSLSFPWWSPSNTSVIPKDFWSELCAFSWFLLNLDFVVDNFDIEHMNWDDFHFQTQVLLQMFCTNLLVHKSKPRRYVGWFS